MTYCFGLTSLFTRKHIFCLKVTEQYMSWLLGLPYEKWKFGGHCEHLNAVLSQWLSQRIVYLIGREQFLDVHQVSSVWLSCLHVCALIPTCMFTPVRCVYWRVFSGRLWGPIGLCEGWRQLPVRDHQLGRGLRQAWKTWSLHKSGQLPRLDPFSNET